MRTIILAVAILMAGCQTTEIPTTVVTFEPPAILMQPPQPLEPIKKK